MWTQYDFPGPDKVPWQLLIRAKYVDEIDAIIAHLAVHSLTAFLDGKRARNLAEGAAKAVVTDGSERIEVSTAQRMKVLGAFADYDIEICPRWWPWPWPWPPRHRFDDIEDPAFSLALRPVQALVRGAGSDHLGKALEGAIGGW